MRSYRLLFSILFLWAFSHKQHAQTLCVNAQPVCANAQNIFPAQTSGNAQVGPNYGCLGAEPNPSWHTLEVSTNGSFTVTVSGSIGGDVDYICYGPFTSSVGMCGSISTGTNIVDCSFSGSSVETLTISSALAGQFYLLLVTNFSGSAQSVIINQTSGTGNLNCSNVCDITGITSTVSSCGPSNTYSVAGTVSVNGVPTVGSLTITNSCGGSPITFNAPFPSPITYSFTNLSANGAACSILAQFSALTTCSLTSNYTAPSTPVVNIASSSNPVCSNSSNATLTASGATTYTWNTGSNSSTLAISPSSTTGFTVTGASSSGCTASASINETVSASPTITAFFIPGIVCSGSPGTLVVSGALSATWQPGGFIGNTVVITPTISTTYTVTGSGGGACTSTSTAFANVINGPSISASSTSSLTCSGNSATLSASGALGYTWYPSGTVASSIVISPTTTTTYSVVGVNGFGCTSTLAVTQSVSPTPTLLVSPTSPSLCAGSSISLTASGATSYTWSPGNIVATSILVSPTGNTTYTVIGSNGTCTNSTTSDVTVVPLPTVGVSVSSPTVCFGSPVTLTGSGASSYTWNPGNLTGNTVSVSPTINTTYTVSGSLSGCSNTAILTVTVINGPVLSLAASPSSVCPGNSSTLTASGALSYTWNPGGQTTSSIIVTPASTTNYSATGVNASGCLTTSTITVFVNPLPVVIVAAAPSSVCAGGATTLSASGASTYTWIPGGATGANIVVSPATSTIYTVTATSALGCTVQTSVGVTVVPIPIVGASSSPTAVCSGSITTLTGTGATSYTWNPGNLIGVSVTVAPTSNTTYTVIGDDAGCTSSAIVAVSVNTNPAISVVAIPSAICPTASSSLVASGALTYTWSAGPTTSSIIVTPASTTIYSVTGTNATGCSTTRTVMVTVNPAPSLTVTAGSLSLCAGSSTSLHALGSASFTWNPGNLFGADVLVTPSVTTTYTVSSLSPFGCPGQDTISISVVPIPTVSAFSAPAGICSGTSATLTANGATSYTWIPIGVTGSVAVVSPTSNTTYTVIGNTAGCTNSNVVTVTVTASPFLTVVASPSILCFGGSSTLTASGALTYTWNPGNLTGSSVVVTPTITTIYSATGTNASGCSTTETVIVTISTPPAIIATASSSSLCAGSSATLSASGAVSYTWNPGNLSGASIVVTPAATTVYTVTGANGAGCTDSAIVTVTVISTPTVTASSSPTAICSGDIATLNASGANSYTWTPGNLTGASVTVSPASSTSYTVTGDVAGCTATSSAFVVVNFPPIPVLAFASPLSICVGDSAQLFSGSGVSYTWMPGSLSGASVFVTPIITTVYTVTAASGSGCTGTATTQVIVSSHPSIVLTAASSSICLGSNDILSASGASTYTWNPGNLAGPSVTVSPSTTTIYTVTGANSSGCSSDTSITISVNPIPSVHANASSVSICSGDSTLLSASGATSYTWIPIGFNSSSVVVSPTVTTTYTLIGNSSSCSNFDTVTVFVNPPTTATVSASPGTICAGSTSTLTASGATNYTWNPGGLTGGTVVVTPAVSTLYSLTANNGASGCPGFQTTVFVQVNPIPFVTITSTGTTVCAGSTVGLSASGATNYTWNPGNLTGANVIVTPAANNTTVDYTVTGDSNGCTAQSVISVLVLSITPVSTPPTICAGNTATLTETGPAGTYTWNPGGVTGSSVAVSPTSTSVYTISGTFSGLTCENTVTVIVNNGPIVSVVSNPSVICAGQQATLTVSGALNYTWQPSGTTGNTIVVSPLATSVFTVFAQSGIGCDGTTLFTLNVANPATIVATAIPPTICQGFTTALVASGATSYTWMPGGATGNIITVAPSSSTTYTVLGDNGACISSDTVDVTVTPAPIITATANPASMCSGDTVTLTASGAISYTWLPMFTAGATVTDSPTSTTSYTVVGLGASGCPNFAVTSVTVFSTPTIVVTSNPPSICIGNTATLTPTGATSYTINPGGIVSNGGSFTVNPSSTTVYTITADNGGCANGQASFTLNVNPSLIISATSSPSVLCSGQTVTLLASGASNYTWSPIGTIGSTTTDTPASSTTYTVNGTDINGCAGSAIVGVTVNQSPSVSIVASSGTICQGAAVTLTASGATNYTWAPIASNTNTLSAFPLQTTTYSATGVDSIGCSSTGTITVAVVTSPILNVTPAHASICSGSSITLTATGATSYTWLPSGTNSSVDIETPTTGPVATYTVIGDNGGNCPSTFTVDVAVIAPPANVVASETGTVTCASPTVALNGSSSSNNVGYTWTGPNSFTTTIQNPIVSGIWGNFTLTVTDSITGCSASATVDVPTDGSIPSVTATTSGSITCAVTTATLIAANTTTNPAYVWFGPGGFSSTVQTVFTTLPGTYTVTVQDLTSGCKVNGTVTVGMHTSVSITTSIIPATCNGSSTNNNGTILAFNFGALDKYDLVTGSTYTGTANYTTASAIPVSSVITSNLSNPTTTLAFTMRLFDAEGCTKDTTLILQSIDCISKAIGVAKAVSTPTLNNDGTYNLTYTVVVKNYSPDSLKNITLNEKLYLTFPSPSTFTINSTPVITSPNSSLNLNTGFDGQLQVSLTNGGTSKMAGLRTDTIVFGVTVNTNGLFGPFRNYITSDAFMISSGAAVQDSSLAGLNPDPDGDNNPTNNTFPTITYLLPHESFHITKAGSVSQRLSDDSYDITYSITVNNAGNDTLYNVNIKDNLFGKTFKQPVTYTIKQGPFADANLTPNTAYNGQSDTSLTYPSKMPPNTSNTIVFVVNVNLDTVTVIKNTAYGNCITSGFAPLSDTASVVLSINNYTLFIPQGFSPDGDAINQFYVIKGLPTNGDNNFTVYNRWGNKVYYKANYDNSWEGYPNVSGIIGSSKLPQGTYYYILDMKGSGMKPVTGFIVLQY